MSRISIACSISLGTSGHVLFAVFRRAQIPAEEGKHVVLEAVRDGAGMRPVMNLETV